MTTQFGASDHTADPPFFVIRRDQDGGGRGRGAHGAVGPSQGCSIGDSRADPVCSSALLPAGGRSEMVSGKRRACRVHRALGIQPDRDRSKDWHPQGAVPVASLERLLRPGPRWRKRCGQRPCTMRSRRSYTGPLDGSAAVDARPRGFRGDAHSGARLGGDSLFGEVVRGEAALGPGHHVGSDAPCAVEKDVAVVGLADDAQRVEAAEHMLGPLPSLGQSAMID